MFYFQDTVVALQALADFASLAYGDAGSTSVEVSGDGIQETFSVSSDNKLLLQRQQIVLPNVINFKVAGDGCVFVQVRIHNR